ncbi:MAG: hypothetical protein WC781_00340 [Candidatus Pacearchaeota archaeon]|jgi:hypothetical protein
MEEEIKQGIGWNGEPIKEIYVGFSKVGEIREEGGNQVRYDSWGVVESVTKEEHRLEGKSNVTYDNRGNEKYKESEAPSFFNFGKPDIEIRDSNGHITSIRKEESGSRGRVYNTYDNDGNLIQKSSENYWTGNKTIKSFTPQQNTSSENKSASSSSSSYRSYSPSYSNQSSGNSSQMTETQDSIFGPLFIVGFLLGIYCLVNFTSDEKDKSKERSNSQIVQKSGNTLSDKVRQGYGYSSSSNEQILRNNNSIESKVINYVPRDEDFNIINKATGQEPYVSPINVGVFKKTFDKKNSEGLLETLKENMEMEPCSDGKIYFKPVNKYYTQNKSKNLELIHMGRTLSLNGNELVKIVNKEKIIIRSKKGQEEFIRWGDSKYYIKEDICLSINLNNKEADLVIIKDSDFF